MPHLRSVLAATLAATVLLAPTAALAYQPAPPMSRGSASPATLDTFGVAIEENVLVTMDDGVRLNATIGRPVDLNTERLAHGTFPVLLQQSPYNSDIASFYVEHGYIVVNVNPRGTQLSEGDIGWNSPRDARDGKALVEWASQLPGSNGTMGLFGCSYHGVNQILTAAKLGPRSPVKAMIPACAWGDPYREGFFSGGVPTQTIPAMPAAFAFAFGGHPSTISFFTELVAEIEAGGPRAYRDEFWADRDTTQAATRIVKNGIPTLLWTGWNDVFESGSIEIYVALQNAAAGRPTHGPMRAEVKADPRFQIIVGPWGHSDGLDDSVMLAWYDHYLKDAPDAFPTSSTMHLYETGGDRWIDTSTFPIDRRYDPLYLGANGTLNSTSAHGRSEGRARVVYAQPDRPGGRTVFTSDPIRRGQTIAGPVSATLYARSSNRQAQLIVGLDEVRSDGTRVRITTGSVLGSMRDLDREASWVEPMSGVVRRPFVRLDHDDYLRPGKVTRFDVSLSPRAWKLARGSRLEVVVTTQVAGCVVTAGTDPCNPTEQQRTSLDGGRYDLVWSKRYPSAVNVPLVDSSSFKSSGPLFSDLAP